MAYETNPSSKRFFLGDERNSDSKYRVLITGFNADGSENFTVHGTTTTDFAIAGSNDFGGERGQAARDALSEVSSNGGKVGQIVGAGVGMYDSVNTASQAIKGRAVVSRTGSEAIWQGSGKPDFQVDLTFVCLDSSKKSESVVDRVSTLMRMVYPDGGEFLTPPLGYSVNGNNSNGKIHLSIGDWFKAEKLICTNCNFTFSKEVNRLGEPIYATGSISLTPYRIITYSEFKGFFLKL